MLSSDEQIRYSRQIVLRDVGVPGQERLKSSSVLVIGAGGLGCPILLYLVSAGVGQIGIIDGDHVNLSNLHRQTLYTTNDIGRLKVDCAKEYLTSINPQVEIVTYPFSLSEMNAMEIIGAYDLVVDGSDNFPTRYLVNDACVLNDKPLIFGAVHQFEGRVSLFNYSGNAGDRGPNYRDLYPVPPQPGLIPDCKDAGVLGVVPGMIGLLQANEALKVLLGLELTLDGRMLIYDALSCRTNFVEIKKLSDNPLTGDAPTQFALVDYHMFCGVEGIHQVSSVAAHQLEELGVKGVDYVLVDVRTKEEVEANDFKAIHISLATLRDRIAEIPDVQSVVFFCQSGVRSREAVKIYNKEKRRKNGKSLNEGIAGLMKIK